MPASLPFRRGMGHMAKRTGLESEQEIEDLSPQDQMEAMENLPEATSVPKKDKALEGVSDAPPAGTRRVVMVGADPFLRKGNPGGRARMFGGIFTMQRNGDLIGDIPAAAAQAHVDVGRMIFIEDHKSPAPPRSADDVARARVSGNVIKV